MMPTRRTSARGLSLVAAVAVLGFAGAVLADDAASVIKARKDYFHVIGKSMKGSVEELKKPAPAIAELQKFAAVIDGEAPKLASHFPAGSGPETGVKTTAIADIWSKPDAFRKAAADFTAAAHNYSVTAQKGDIASTGAALKALGGTCKACHEQFRHEDH
jgi:cytochrome c556